MSTVSQSPFPNNIKTLYVPRPNYAAGELVWGFQLTAEGCTPLSADWAMPMWQVVELARSDWEIERRTAAYQYFMPYADSMALRAAEEPAERELDDDATLFLGQNYGYFAENGGW